MIKKICKSFLIHFSQMINNKRNPLLITDEDFPRPTRENQHSDQGREKGLRALTPPQPAAPVSAFAGVQRQERGSVPPLQDRRGTVLSIPANQPATQQ